MFSAGNLITAYHYIPAGAFSNTQTQKSTLSAFRLKGGAYCGDYSDCMKLADIISGWQSLPPVSTYCIIASLPWFYGGEK
jgi:hypothetical protein